MTQARLWIVCEPSARDAANKALAAVSADWADTLVCQVPGGRTIDAPLPPARYYWAGWQDTAEELDRAQSALSRIPGVRVVVGATVGLEREDAAESDKTRGDVATKYRREAALEKAADSLAAAIAVAEPAAIETRR